jgi:hypothetical protein
MRSLLFDFLVRGMSVGVNTRGNILFCRWLLGLWLMDWSLGKFKRCSFGMILYLSFLVIQNILLFEIIIVKVYLNQWDLRILYLIWFGNGRRINYRLVQAKALLKEVMMIWLIIQVYLNSFLNGIFSGFLLNGIHHVRGGCILHLYRRGWGLGFSFHRIHTQHWVGF